MTHRRFQAPSSAFAGRRRRIQSDNITLIPASQLPFKAEWEKIANQLPAREALMVIPSAETPFKRVARALVPQLSARGRHVTVAGPQSVGVTTVSSPSSSDLS